MKLFLFMVLFSFTNFAYSEDDYNTFDLTEYFPDITFVDSENIPTWGSDNLLGDGAVISYSFAEFDYDCARNIVVGGDCSSLSSSAFMPENYQGVISSAFDAWEEVANLSFNQVVDQAGDVVIGTGELVNPDALGYGGFYTPSLSPYGYSSIETGFMYFDDGRDWNDYDLLFGVALHEVGHVLGLDHSDDPSSIMYKVYSSTKDSLQPDDITGITYLYGAPVSAVPEPSTYLLFLLGLAMVLGYGRKTRLN